MRDGVAEDVLGFAGIAPPTLRIYPIETHIAEKLHAFTLPRARPNSRVKDLPDLALLASAGPLEAERLRAALEQTFTFRKTHALPAALPAPPPDTKPEADDEPGVEENPGKWTAEPDTDAPASAPVVDVEAVDKTAN